MTRKEKFHKRLVKVFFLSLVFATGFTFYYMKNLIPDRLNVVVNEEQSFHFPIPIGTTILSESEEVVLGNGSNIPSNEVKLTLNQPLTLYSGNQGSYQLGLKLFGWLEFKEIQVNVVDSQYAIPCGAPIGIYLKSNGIMVIGTGEIPGPDGTVLEPAFGILQSGDYIEAINGSPLRDKEALVQQVNDLDGQEAVLKVRRGGENIEVKVNPVLSADGDYKLGAWVRDDTQGIGTMTYLDLNGNFGALGHGISDSDTGEVVQISEGDLYETEIMGIEKGSIGKPGVMSGVIYYGNQSKLGHINANTDAGIFGTINDGYRGKMTEEPIEIGYRQDVHKGEAFLRSSISGESKDYKIEIQRVDENSAHKNKGLVVRVTDPELLALTGGIVQGMSGSPIIQDGKLVGAVTHVFIQDSTRGYGIFIENMLAAGNQK